MNSSDRIPLTPLVAAVLHQGPKQAQNVAVEAMRVQLGDAARMQMHPTMSANKVSLYAVLAPVLQELVRRTVDQLRADPEMAEIATFSPEVLSHPFELIQAGVYEMLTSNLKTLRADIESDELKAFLAESFRLYGTRQSLRTGEHQKRGFMEFVASGIGTSVNIMRNTLEVIPKVARREGYEASPQELADIARASYPMLMRLSAMFLDDFLHMTKRCVVNPSEGLRSPFSPEAFILVDSTRGGKRLAVRPDILEEFTTSHFANTQPTLGCPAHVKVGGQPDAISMLWNWQVDQAAAIYERWKM